MKPFIQRTIIVAGIFILAAVLSGYILFKTYTGFTEQLLQRTALLLGQAVEETLRNAASQNLDRLTAVEKSRLRQLMSSMTTETGHIIHILLINSQMKILLSSDRSIEGHEYKSPEEIARLQSDKPQVLRRTWEGNFRIVDVIIPLRDTEGNVFGHLRMVLSHEGLSVFFKDLTTAFVPLLIIFTVLLMLSAYLLSKSYRKPLDSLRKVAQRLSSGDFDYRVKYPRQDEFTDTFVQINKSMEKFSGLRESYKKIESRITALLQAVDESILLIDAEENISSYNRAAMKLMQCPPDQKFELYFKEIKSLNPDLKGIIKKALEGNEIESGQELTLLLPNDDYTLFRVSTQIFREGNRVNGVLLTLKDLHVLNELEHNLLRSMKFGVIANLASSISHELRTPLSSMAIHSEIIRGRLAKTKLKENDNAYKSLHVLQNEVNRLNRIINQFLNLARSKQTNLVQLKINDVINDVLVLVQQQAIERNILVKTKFDESLDYIYGDPDQLKQVILNIVLNGFQAIDSDGTLYIRTRRSKNRILVEIQDTGTGMPPEVQEHLFELYFTTKSDGGGIGLAISKNIMQAHEGRITFESAQGKGTVFFLDFPTKDFTKTLRKFNKNKQKI